VGSKNVKRKHFLLFLCQHFQLEGTRPPVPPSHAPGHDQVERRRRECRGAAGAEGVGYFHDEMAHFVGILGVNFKCTL